LLCKWDIALSRRRRGGGGGSREEASSQRKEEGGKEGEAEKSGGGCGVDKFAPLSFRIFMRLEFAPFPHPKNRTLTRRTTFILGNWEAILYATKLG
jgi:hypothetical protein